MTQAPSFKIEIEDGLDIETPDEAIEYIKGKLWPVPNQSDNDEAGRALTRLFGRLIELVINRLNKMPEKHFLAFLNAAGTELLPARAASSEVTFTLAKDAPCCIHIPQGTQVATLQTKIESEVIFETQRDLVVAPNTLLKCIAIDSLNLSDCTEQANRRATFSQAGFSAFQGEQERERCLYLRDDELFGFPDNISQQAAKIILNFAFALPGNPKEDGGWKLTWHYYDDVAKEWEPLRDQDPQRQVEDLTSDFTTNGNVTFTNLPKFTKTTVNGQEGLWLMCRLTGGIARDHLPMVRNITARREIDLSSIPIPINTALSAIQSGTAFVPIDPNTEFFPLGVRPTRLDTFYLRVDEAFNKHGTKIYLQMDLQGVNAPTSLNPQVEWEYYSNSNNKWTGLKTLSDDTNSFTKTVENLFITFTVADTDPKLDKTKVNGQEGYWIRARLASGSYTNPGGLSDTANSSGIREWHEPQTFAPLIKKITVTCEFKYNLSERSIAACYSQVDGVYRPSKGTQFFAPFSSDVEDPALYLGFEQAFPSGEWMQFLLDVTEIAGEYASVGWEYWDGLQWTTLRIADGTHGLKERGYLGFFGPKDHQPSIEFGKKAYWLRVTPLNLPNANAGGDQTVTTLDAQKIVTLDASNSRGFGVRSCTARYIWRVVSSRPIAEAGPDKTFSTSEDQISITLDGSRSQPVTKRNLVSYNWRQLTLFADAGQDQTGFSTENVTLNASRSQPAAAITNYTWRKIEPETPEPETSFTMPYIRQIWLNTVPVLNAATIQDEHLGSSNGKRSQTFNLLRSPVLPDIQVAVREPDVPPPDELTQLEHELKRDDINAQVLLSKNLAPQEGIWVRWHHVADFSSSGPSNRHFSLDPINGQVHFGDGLHGKIPPIGFDNIRAIVYRAHNGAAGNVRARAISVLRNPSGDLANIKAVTNPEAAAGGSAAEMVDEVELRGPQAIKHRQRAVTIEDYAWLAREASSEVAHAYCLPVRNRLGLLEPGWVTIVVTPKSSEAMPTPSPALIRAVSAYLQEHALVNLSEVNHIYVKVPEYIQTTVNARVVPVEQEKADEVHLTVLERLENFLHPLQGGPDRSGWELGRDVFLSEVCTEIEAVPGVDHVASINLRGSLQQYRLYFKQSQINSYFLPTDSQVGTFDERIKLLSAEAAPAGKQLDSIIVYGFKVGDLVDIIAADNTKIIQRVKIASISETGDVINFAASFAPPNGWDQREAMTSLDGRIRLLLDSTAVDNNSSSINSVSVKGFEIDMDDICIVAGEQRDSCLEFLSIARIEPCRDHIYIPVGYLVYSGNHNIEMVLE